MIAKLAIVEEEADESIYWIELLIDAGIVPAARLADLLEELDQIVALTVASQKTLRCGNLKARTRGGATIHNPESKIQNDDRSP
jgi:hypothetical protein